MYFWKYLGAHLNVESSKRHLWGKHKCVCDARGIVVVYVSGSQVHDSSNRQPLCQVLQKGRYTAVNHTCDVFFYIPVLYLSNQRVNKGTKTTILL